MSLRKKPTFEELILNNREQILNDEQQLSEIEEKIDKRMNETL